MKPRQALESGTEPHFPNRFLSGRWPRCKYQTWCVFTHVCATWLRVCALFNSLLIFSLAKFLLWYMKILCDIFHCALTPSWLELIEAYGHGKFKFTSINNYIGYIYKKKKLNSIAVCPSKPHVNSFCVNETKANVLKLYSLQCKCANGENTWLWPLDGNEEHTYFLW